MRKKTLCVFLVVFSLLLGAETGRKAAIMASPGDDEIMGYNPTNESPNLASDKGDAPLWASDEQICSFSNNYKNNTYTLERRSNGDLYVCFYNNDYDRVELHRSTDDGESWSRIWYKSDRECPSMVLTDNYVYIACAKPYGSEYDIVVYKVSFSGTQQSYKNVAISTAEEYYPHITTDAEQYSYSSTYLYIVWSKTISSGDKDIYFSSLEESDLSTVIDSKWLVGAADVGAYIRPRLDYEYYSSTDYLHLAFWDYDDDQIYYKRSTNFGSSWSTKTKRSEDGQHPDISVYNNKVFLVYEHSSQGCTWSYSTNSGSSWSDNLHFSTPRHYPRCHVTSGRWHMAAYRNNRATWYYIANPTPSGTWTYTYVSDGTVPNASALDQDIYASSNTNVGLCWRGTNGAYFDASWRQNVQPPVANFSGTPRSGCEPLSVAFTDLSTNNPTSWSWSFGDGGTSSLQNPTHVYSNAGTYTVSLTATNAAGSDTETKTNYITVNEEPVAEFSGNPTSGCAPLTVDFTDESTNDPTSWSWDFGDGGSSSSQNPTHTYDDPGTYTVSLTASNNCGSDTETKTDYITVNACDEPTAKFSGDPTSGCVSLTVDFTDESTGDPTEWAWDFGDGDTSSEQNPSHTYTEKGTYTVSLTVTNDYGEDTETKEDYITVGEKPTAEFSGYPTSGPVSLTVVFTDASIGDPTSWYWDFGDGGSSSSQNRTYTYDKAGTYSVSLTASNDCGDDIEMKPDYIVVYPTGIMEADAVPSAYILYQNTPNPVVNQTSIRYGLPEISPISVYVYDVTGRVVCNLVDETKEAGYYTVTWNGTDETGQSVPSGVYFYRFTTDEACQIRKMLLLR